MGPLPQWEVRGLDLTMGSIISTSVALDCISELLLVKWRGCLSLSHQWLYQMSNMDHSLQLLDCFGHAWHIHQGLIILHRLQNMFARVSFSQRLSGSSVCTS